MQIFHWHSKPPQHQPNEDNHIHNKEAREEDIVLFKEGGRDRRRERRKLRAFAFVCRKDVATACFYSTLNLKKIDNRKEHWINYSMKMKKQDLIDNSNNHHDSVSTSHHVGNKVLPITDTTTTTITLSSSNTSIDKINADKLKGDHKIKAMSRMKDLLRWAAAAKSDNKAKFLGRKVLQFRNRAAIKAEKNQNEEEISNNESPKISFRWEVESNTSSVCSSMASSSTLHMLSFSSSPLHHRKGNWITTDSEFVVLEL